MSELDQVVLDVMLLGLESTFYRFEADTWYKYDAKEDALYRVLDVEHIEKEFQERKNSS